MDLVNFVDNRQMMTNCGGAKTFKTGIDVLLPDKRRGDGIGYV